MAGSTGQAIKLGAILGAITGGSVAVERLIGHVFSSTSDIGASFRLMGAARGAVAGALVVGLVFSPLWTPIPNDKRTAAIVAGVTVVVSTFFMSGVAMLVAVLALGAMFSLGTAKLLPYSAPMGERLGVILGAIGAMAVAVFAVTIPLDFVVPDGGFAAWGGITFIAALAVSRPMLWVLLRTKAEQARSPLGAALPPFPPGPLPRGWAWGKLHLRATGQKSFGFLYIDPMAGASFHSIADLSAPLDADAMRAAGYRGTTTTRLGGYETLHPVPGLNDFQRETFEKGGVVGTVVLVLSEEEIASLGLPPAPPWAAAYLPRAA